MSGDPLDFIACEESYRSGGGWRSGGGVNSGGNNNGCVGLAIVIIVVIAIAIIFTL